MSFSSVKAAQCSDFIFAMKAAHRNTGREHVFLPDFFFFIQLNQEYCIRRRIRCDLLPTSAAIVKKAVCSGLKIVPIVLFPIFLAYLDHFTNSVFSISPVTRAAARLTARGAGSSGDGNTGPGREVPPDRCTVEAALVTADHGADGAEFRRAAPRCRPRTERSGPRSVVVHGQRLRLSLCL